MQPTFFRARLWRFLAFCSLAGLLVLPACAAGQNAAAGQQATPTAIPTPALAAKQTYTVTKGNIISQLKFSGRVIPVTEQQAFFRVDGRVRKLYVKSGDTVKQGEVLADLLSLDDLQKSQAQQDIDQQRAEINLKMAQLRRSIAATQTPLYSSSRDQELALQDLQVQLAELDFQQQQLNGELVAGSIQDAQLIAPIDGQVLTFQIREGDAVKAYDPVAVVGDLQHLEVGAQLADTQLQGLTEGKACKASLTISSDQEYDCTIRSLPYPYGTANTSQPSSSSSPALAIDNSNTRVEINTPAGVSLRMGDMVSIRVVLQEKDGVLLLPVGAIRSFEGRSFVVVQAGATSKRVDIKTGLTSEDMMEVVSGLNEGDVVIAP